MNVLSTRVYVNGTVKWIRREFRGDGGEMMLMSSVNRAVYLRVRGHVERTEGNVFERNE